MTGWLYSSIKYESSPIIKRSELSKNKCFFLSTSYNLNLNFWLGHFEVQGMTFRWLILKGEYDLLGTCSMMVHDVHNHNSPGMVLPRTWSHFLLVCCESFCVYLYYILVIVVVNVMLYILDIVLILILLNLMLIDLRLISLGLRVFKLVLYLLILNHWRNYSACAWILLDLNIREWNIWVLLRISFLII